MDDNEHGQSIIKRRVELCDSLQVVFDYDASELVMSCDSCGSYYMLCCYHFHLGQCDHGDPCHHFPIVFVDGACSQNGTSSAAAGIGGAMGHYADDQWSLAIDDAVDFGGRRTSQRAELLAAIEGVRRIAESERCSRRSGEHSSTEFVIASDSDYVVNGMTEKYPNWKVLPPVSCPQLTIFTHSV